MSASKQGQAHPYYNKGKQVFLYSVRAHGLVLIATFPNKVRAGEHLSISRTTVANYIKNRTLFEFHGSAHMLSWNANLLI